MRIGREKINHISSLIIKDFKRREELDYKADLNDLRLEIAEVMTEELKVVDRADEAARKTLASYTTKKLREGSPEWDVLYQKHFEDYLKKHGA
ncbi:MAG: hypothetical protein COV67_02180 [Nitrospinae bacterium CG11_big_fil_rev_8_21_14_0_20_56_8]|nr:MAG: hypothetical protein COV67_02180 [Nitrospinae bacterium CG11_big_fil_rev_8_21_14_0_20_56_8]